MGTLVDISWQTAKAWRDFSETAQSSIVYIIAFANYHTLWMEYAKTWKYRYL